MASTIDPSEFREGQRQQWDKAATGWDRWQTLMDDGARQISERLVELAGVQPGSRVLDVAAGLGEPSMSAARVAGAEGKVVASDISAEMLAYAKRRAEREGIDNIEFVESAAMALDFPPDSFDAALSRWGIIFDPDGEGAAARVRGFLTEGSRMAIASWGPPDRVPMLGVPMRTVLDLVGADPPPPGTPGPLSRPTPDAIGGLLEGGGFSDVEVEEVEIEFEWESPEQFTVFVREIAPPITALLAGQDDETRDRAWQAITDAIGAQAADDGTLRLANLVLMASGRA